MKKYKRISFYAFRKNLGATGGPGGVLYLQKTILGRRYNDIKLRYVFHSKNKTFCRLFKDFYLGAIVQVFLKELFRKDNYYVCNDIGTAYAMSLLKKDFSLIYHNQGPIVEELTNFGVGLSKRKKRFLEKVERGAFVNAKSVHFPSSGAEKMFFNSSYCTCKRDEVNVGMVLPNTIEIEPKEPAKNGLTFLSVGTLTSAKGQDLTIDFIKKFLTKYKKPIRYIVIGDGVLREKLLAEYRALKKENENFDFAYYRRLPHNEIISIANAADVYVMLHRISIFDLATLEAMSQSCAVVLSDVGGNRDFNVDDNVILVDPNDFNPAIKALVKADVQDLKRKNREVFMEHFSPRNFKENLHKMLQGIIGE